MLRRRRPWQLAQPSRPGMSPTRRPRRPPIIWPGSSPATPSSSASAAPPWWPGLSARGDRRAAIHVTNQSILLAVVLGLLGSAFGLAGGRASVEVLETARRRRRSTPSATCGPCFCCWSSRSWSRRASPAWSGRATRARACGCWAAWPSSTCRWPGLLLGSRTVAGFWF